MGIKHVVFLVYVLICVAQVVSVRVHHKGSLNMGLLARGLSPHQGAQAEPKYFDQKVDHFDPTNHNTFKQLYYVNDTFWTGAAKGGPIFIVLGGEGPISPAYVTGHFIVSEYAAIFGALIVGVEHRFYGQSIPTSDLSTKNLNLLTTVQALADFAQFRHFIATTYNATSSKWISFGGSYSGSLSAWFRLKYPHLIDGSIATSAPVLAQLNFPEYFEVIQRSIGPSCARRVARVTSIVTSLLGSSEGRTRLQKLFSTCSPIGTSSEDVATFMSSLSDGLCDIVQYNDDNKGTNPFNIPKACSIIEAGGDSDDAALQAYANFVDAWNKYTGDNCTESSYASTIKELSNTSPKSAAASSRSWTWQTCTEYGYFQTGDSTAQPFSRAITLSWYLQICKDVFGSALTPNIVAINDIFGAKQLRQLRIVLGNGSVDPWHILGITTPHRRCDESDLTVLYMNGTAHCADLYPSRSSDLPALTQTRRVEQASIASWLNAQC